MRTLNTVAVACMVGALVAGLTLVAAWQQVRDDTYLNSEQRITGQKLHEVDRAIQDYKKDRHSLPRSLTQLATAGLEHGVRADADGTVRDGWERPFIYAVSAGSYRIVSYGRDGKPGGIGLDADLTNVAPRPPEARITFRQLLSVSGANEAIWTAAIAGVLACLLAVFAIRPADVTRQGALVLLAKVAATVVATVFVASIIAALHFGPPGH